MFTALPLPAAEAAGALDRLSFGGDISEEEASFTFSGSIKGGGEKDEFIYSSKSQSNTRITRESMTQTIQFEANVVRGSAREFVLHLQGQGDVTSVQGGGLLDWGIRRDAESQRYLVIRIKEANWKDPQLRFKIQTRHPLEAMPASLHPILPSSAKPNLHEGQIRIQSEPSLQWSVESIEGLTSIGDAGNGSEAENTGSLKMLAWRYFAVKPRLSLAVSLADPDADRVLFDNFSLAGTVRDRHASFALRGTARTSNPDGGRLLLLGGSAALTELPRSDRYRIEYVEPEFRLHRVQGGDTLSGLARENRISVEQIQQANQLPDDRIQAGQQLVLPRPSQPGGYYLVLEGPGEFPVELRFNARIADRAPWKSLQFEVAPGSLRPVELQGLPADAEFEFESLSKPRREGHRIFTHLSSSGGFQLKWKEAPPEEAGRLFYSVESLTDVVVRPGLMAQTQVLDVRVTQGAMRRLDFDLIGEGEVVRVVGGDILSWSVDGSGENRRLRIELNQPKESAFTVSVQTQKPLGEFPLSIDPMRLNTEEAIRFGGHVRIRNEGAVSLDVSTVSGLSQISPDQFPQSGQLTGAGTSSQVFAFRFSDGTFQLTAQADNILPELTVSQVLVHHVGHTEASIDAELELDIREAPLREFTLRIPQDYIVSGLSHSSLSDYFQSSDETNAFDRLRLVFTQPLTGRQAIRLQLQRNRPLETNNWELPILEPEEVKTVRGYVGVTADEGLRLTAVNVSESLTELGPAYFPRRIDGLQLAWRIREQDWNATIGIEQLELTIQTDSFHLFSIAEGIAYGSSVVNYLISGSPVSTLEFTAPEGYGNVEFIGREVRSWKQVDDGYEVYLHSPVSGAYTLLATYDRQFAPQGETLGFQGMQPDSVQSDQGYVIVISDFQFRVSDETVSTGLIELEPGEIPAEHRLLFAAPVLASYQYISRPFDLSLQMRPLAQGETREQVIDHASIQTGVSSEGHVLTEVEYLLKSRGHAHLRLAIPEGVDLWNVLVDGGKVVPVADNGDTLIPLPRHDDPNTIITIALSLAARSANPMSVQAALPVASVPVLQTEWKVDPESNHRLIFKSGSLQPENATLVPTGFDWLARLFTDSRYEHDLLLLGGALVALIVGVAAMRFATREGRERYEWRNLAGLLIGLGGIGFSLLFLLVLMGSPVGRGVSTAAGLMFSTPILDAGTAVTVQLSNVEWEAGGGSIWSLWPVLFGLIAWIYQFRIQGAFARKVVVLVGWLLVFWGTLKWQNSPAPFLTALIVFLLFHIVWPMLRRQFNLPKRETSSTPPAAATGATALLLFGLLGGMSSVEAANAVNGSHTDPVVHSLVQEAEVRDGMVQVDATLHWSAQAGQYIDFLRAPAVLTSVDFPKADLTSLESSRNGQSVNRLTAKKAGEWTVRFQYQVPVVEQNGRWHATLTTTRALVNRLQFDVIGQDVQVNSDQAVSVDRRTMTISGVESSRAELILEPAASTTVEWRPRSRDTSAEQAVYYADFNHILVPYAGVVEGWHHLQVRLAQGELNEVRFNVPVPLTITDVVAPFVANWRFDPDQRLLRVQFSSPQSGSFQLNCESQIATRPLPYQQEVGLLKLEGAAGQIGTIGIFTGSEVQLESVQTTGLASINLEDLSGRIPNAYQNRVQQLTLRRAWRFADTEGKLTLSAAPVEPDIRVVTSETLSLGEDRTVLAVNLTAAISRAGIFKLSFPLPDNLAVETLTGDALSHWTESEIDGQRMVTLNLKGKTLGQQQFSMSLSGPGMIDQTQIEPPRLQIREATKQQGQLTVAPDLGLRLHVSEREGATLLDPRELGIRQRGVLAFRLLQGDWQLTLDVEKVDPWIQVTLLQEIAVREGQVEVAGLLEYQIENAGVNVLQVQVPAAAESTSFQGEHLTDSVRLDPGTNTLATWEVKLSRRIIGKYPLTIRYQQPIGSLQNGYTATGIQASGANLQRGFLTLRTGGRLDLSAPDLPEALVASDWQSIPASIRQRSEFREPTQTYRVIEPAYSLPINVVRHDVADLLPARVERVDLMSTLSVAGELLTEVKVSLHPGDKRMLGVRLPEQSEFWFAFVNGESELPWREEGQIMIPIEPHAESGQPTLVEFFYTSRAADRERASDFELIGPQFDLPLKNITWKLHTPQQWTIEKWNDRWQLSRIEPVVSPRSTGASSYYSVEMNRQREKAEMAESLLQKGNELLQQGDQTQARKAYRAAMELSQHDAALNEDARVQLQNLKTQQAIVGLNFRLNNAFTQQAEADQAPAPGFQLGQEPAYTQQQVQQLLQNNSSEDNAAMMRLADRLVRQQEAAVKSVEAIHATLPQQGRQSTFTRSLLIDEWGELKLDLSLEKPSEGSGFLKLVLLVGLTVIAGILVVVVNRMFPAQVKNDPLEG